MEPSYYLMNEYNSIPHVLGSVLNAEIRLSPIVLKSGVSD